MDPGVDPTAIAVADFDEDPDESFTGPNGLNEFFNEEYEQDEYYDDDGEGYEEPEPLVRSAAQRTGQPEPGHAETVSGHTQCSSNAFPPYSLSKRGSR